MAFNYYSFFYSLFKNVFRSWSSSLKCRAVFGCSGLSMSNKQPYLYLTSWRTSSLLYIFIRSLVELIIDLELFQSQKYGIVLGFSISLDKALRVIFLCIGLHISRNSIITYMPSSSRKRISFFLFPRMEFQRQSKIATAYRQYLDY